MGTGAGAGAVVVKPVGFFFFFFMTNENLGFSVGLVNGAGVGVSGSNPFFVLNLVICF